MALSYIRAGPADELLDELMRYPMKRIVFSAIACTLAASASLAAPAPKESSVQEAKVLLAEKANGTIKKVNAEGKSFVLLVDEKEVTITYGAATKFLLDGKEVDAARLLQVGGKVNVTHEGSVAQKVEGTSKTALLVAEQASGTVKKLNAEGKSFVLVVEEKEVPITYGAATKFILDGKEVDAARLLQIGAKVNVTHEGGVAQRIEGTSKTAFLVAEQAKGTIMNVNVESKSFIIVVEDKETTVSYTASTKFLLDGKEVDAARLLQVGTKVTVSHEKNVALKVESDTKS